MMQFSAKCTIIIQGSCYLHSRTVCIFPSFKQFLEQNIERERFTYCVLEHICLMHVVFLQSVEVAQDAGWIHLLVFTFSSPVRSLEKCENTFKYCVITEFRYNLYIFIYLCISLTCLYILAVTLQLPCLFLVMKQFSSDIFKRYLCYVHSNGISQLNRNYSSLT